MSFRILAGPCIGAIIGYFTNYIAVKMLFRPRRELHIFGKRLPFTPGVIPKGKPRLAKAVGKVVADTLITKEDVKEKLLSAEIKSAVSAKIVKAAEGSIREIVQTAGNLTAEEFGEKKDRLCERISGKIHETVMQMSVGEKASEAIKTVVLEKFNEFQKSSALGGMMGMFLSEDKIISFIAPLGDKIEEYVREHGKEYIQPVVEEKAEEIAESSALVLLDAAGMPEEALRNAAESLYLRIVDANIDALFSRIDIDTLIEEKINGMNVIDLENMVMSVMKKELNTIVRLGALIGAVIGTLNIFI